MSQMVILRMTFQIQLVKWKVLYFYSNFITIYS